MTNDETKRAREVERLRERLSAYDAEFQYAWYVGYRSGFAREPGGPENAPFANSKWNYQWAYGHDVATSDKDRAEASEAERDQLREQVERLRMLADSEYRRGQASPNLTIKSLRVERDQLRAEVERLRAELNRAVQAGVKTIGEQQARAEAWKAAAEYASMELDTDDNLVWSKFCAIFYDARALESSHCEDESGRDGGNTEENE